MQTIDSLRVDEDRLWRSLMDMGRIGATPRGGVGRVALTELDREARDLFVRWCEEAGCDVGIDRMGNIFARRAGTEPGRAPVLTGSHLDTQPLGGKFDGIFGVLSGLEIIRALNDADVRTRAPIETVVWTDEEGVRFAGMLASGVFAGVYELDDALARTDRDGVTMAQALERIGYAGTAPATGRPVDAFFEAHIEQGPVLEAEGATIGVVLGAQGQRCFEITVDGAEGHAGTLPMDRRHDALLAAARMVDAVNSIAFRHHPHPVITVGRMEVRPNSPNTIPGQAVFSIDSRHPDDDLLAKVAHEMRADCERIADEGAVALGWVQTSERRSVTFHPECVEIVRDAARMLGLAHRDMYSGAGHDACHLALKAPTAMIFVPCEKGISHNEQENASPGDLAAGCNVLLHAMLARAGTA